MARFTIEIETVDATPAEWVDALAKVRGLPSFELAENPVTRTDVEVAAERVAEAALSEAEFMLKRIGTTSPREPVEVFQKAADAVKALTCSAYSAMRLVGGAK